MKNYKVHQRRMRRRRAALRAVSHSVLLDLVDQARTLTQARKREIESSSPVVATAGAA